jgi:hypothetical protein
VGFKDFGYEVIKKGGEALGCHLMRGMEEAPAALRFDFIPTLEVNGRQRVERWQAGERWLGQRKETTPKVGWAGVGHTAKKPPGLVHDLRAGRVQCTEMGQKAEWTGRTDELAREEFSKKRSWAAMVSCAENQKGYRKNPFEFYSRF